MAHSTQAEYGVGVTCPAATFQAALPSAAAALPHAPPGCREIGMSLLLSLAFVWLLHFTLLAPYMTQVRGTAAATAAIAVAVAVAAAWQHGTG